MFVAGGTAPSDHRWLDGLLFEALADASPRPKIELLSAGLNYGRHVLPLIQSAEQLNVRVGLTLARGAQRPDATFAAHLIERIAELAELPSVALEVNGDISRHVSPWSRRAAARLIQASEGLR